MLQNITLATTAELIEAMAEIREEFKRREAAMTEELAILRSASAKTEVISSDEGYEPFHSRPIRMKELIGAQVPNDKRKGTVAAKYRGPNGEEWSGRGLPPKWLTATGLPKEHFLI